MPRPRRAALPKAARPVPAPTVSEAPATGSLAKVAGITDEAVRAKTGCGWAEWFRRLDRADSEEKSHRLVARWLHEEYELSIWWSQMVTVAWEQERGLREVHQSCEGDFEASASKTFPVPLAVLERAWTQADARVEWLDHPEFDVRLATARKSMRITWRDGTHLDVYFWVKGPGKSQVTLQHKKLNTAAQVQEIKRYWKKNLGQLAAWLKG